MKAQETTGKIFLLFLANLAYDKNQNAEIVSY